MRNGLVRIKPLSNLQPNLQCVFPTRIKKIAHSRRWIHEEDESYSAIGYSRGSLLANLFRDYLRHQAPLVRGTIHDVEKAIFRNQHRKLEVEDLHSYVADIKTGRLYDSYPLLHLAVLSQDFEFVKKIVKMFPSEREAVDRIRKQTALHWAVLFRGEDTKIMELLFEVIDEYKRDSMFASIADYARLLGEDDWIPPNEQPSYTNEIKVWNKEDSKIEYWPVSKLEKELNIQFYPGERCGNTFLLELLQPKVNPEGELVPNELTEEVNLEELKNLKVIKEPLIEPILPNLRGDEDLILCHIDKDIGWGVYADKDFLEGDVIVPYGGYLEPFPPTKKKSGYSVVGKKRSKDKGAYNVSCTIPHYVVNGRKIRNLGAMINHSNHPNASIEYKPGFCMSNIRILATCFIPRGAQIFLDYGDDYDTKSFKETLTGTYKDYEFPSIIPKIYYE